MTPKVHPSQRREVDRKFHWRFGHSPHDDDARPDSGWHYLRLDYYQPSEPDQRNLLTGGPDTGHPCLRCGNNTYRIAAERDMAWVANQPGVEIVNKDDLDMEELAKDSIVIWACPSCSDTLQWRRSEMPPLKEKE